MLRLYILVCLLRWLHEIDANCDVVNRILVGNKNDDPDRKVLKRGFLSSAQTSHCNLAGGPDRRCPKICRPDGNPAFRDFRQGQHQRGRDVQVHHHLGPQVEEGPEGETGRPLKNRPHQRSTWAAESKGKPQKQVLQVKAKP